MKLNKFSYKHKPTGWEVLDVTFPRLSLLVGLSGVGKTRVLRSIAGLAKIAQGHCVDGAQWELEFTVSEVQYKWEGEYDSRGFSFNDIFDQNDKTEKSSLPILLKEKIFKNGSLVASRSDGNVEYMGSATPKLSPEVSLLKLFQEEKEIKPITEALSKVHFIDGTSTSFGNTFFDFLDDTDTDDILSICDLRSSKMSAGNKFRIASQKGFKEFEVIKEAFIEVFPFIEDLKIATVDAPDVPRFLKDEELIQFKEVGVSSWAPVFKMSSGMLKTLEQLAMTEFYPKDSVFLIDEFENSLGANCVDFVTDSIIESSSNSQFILTSHHPIVVNNIGMEHWRVVRRRAGAVEVLTAEELGVGHSRHEHYTQLMNKLLF